MRDIIFPAATERERSIIQRSEKPPRSLRQFLSANVFRGDQVQTQVDGRLSVCPHPGQTHCLTQGIETLHREHGWYKCLGGCHDSSVARLVLLYVRELLPASSCRSKPGVGVLCLLSLAEYNAADTSVSYTLNVHSDRNTIRV